MTDIIYNLLDKPKIISIIADTNEGKSNLIYYLIDYLNKKYKYNLYVYGLRNKIKGSKEINSLYQLELIKDSIIFIDEFISLFDLNDRKKKKTIENTLRLINHNNNILFLIGLPENFKKFISAKSSVFIYKKVTFDDFIRGSTVSKNLLNCEILEKGSSILNIPKDEAIIWDGNFYEKIKIPYMKKYDSKKNNEKILKKISKKVIKK